MLSENNDSNKLWAILVLFLGIGLFENMDHGSIPAATIPIARDYNLTQVGIGALGSVTFAGLTVGSCIAGLLLSNYSIKWLLGIATMLTGASLFSLAQADGDVIVIYASRFLTGFF